MPSASASPRAAGSQLVPVGGKISRIELHNFKSYGGRQVIGPFGDFTAVIGPNGAGKSNLMDAISFVVGLASKDLRGKQLKDLIYRATSDTGDEERSAHVSLVYELNGVETNFKRTISSSGVGEYRIDGRVARAEAYAARLKACGILTKAHTGFLVFQGYISELAGKSPTELTALFEQISGSDELKEEYERLEKEKKRAEEEQIYTYQKKKGLTQERNNMKKQKEEAEQYAALLVQRREVHCKLYMIRLYAVEREVARLQQALADASASADADAAAASSAEDAVKNLEKEKARLTRKVVELERKSVTMSAQLEGKTPDAIRLREEIALAQKRRGMAMKSLEKVVAQQQKAEKQEATLAEERDQIEEAIAELEAAQAAAEAERPEELEFDKKKQADYNRLKAEAGAKTAAVTEQIQKKKREIRGDEPALLQLRSRVEEIGAEAGTVETKAAAFEERRAAGEERVKELGAKLKSLGAQTKVLSSSSSKARAQRDALEAKLTEIHAALRSSKAEHRESERERKSTEALENLMRLFPGVHGRTNDICKPTQKKYHAAVTIAMGKNMDAIVVEEEATAIACIAYLKDQKCAPETFIPLDTIRAKPAREALRQLGGSKKPVQDVISAPERFVKAVQFSVGDAVVCDSLDEARTLAYHSGGSERYKVVTIDGTLINKAGLITGGSSPGEKARASKWSAKEHEHLKRQEAEISHELEALTPALEAEEAEQTLRHAVQAATQELATAKADLELTNTKVAKHGKETSAFTASLEQTRAQLKAAEAKRAQAEGQLASLQREADQEEDRIFSSFSKSVGVASVREYEEKTLRYAQEKQAELLALGQQRDRLNAQLEFEKRKDLPAAVSKLRTSIEEEERTLAAKEAAQAKLEAAALKLRGEASRLEEECKEAKEQQAVKQGELKAVKKEARNAADAVAASRTKAHQIENDLEQQRGHRLRIFQRARLDEAELPLLGEGEEPEGLAATGKKGKRKRGSAGEEGGGGGASAQSAGFSLLASEEFSPSGLVGTATLEGEAEGEEGEGGPSAAADEGEKVRINFSSIDDETREGDLGATEAELAATLEENARQTEGMAPNMKALAQYDEVQERLHECEGEFEGSRTTAKSVTQQFAVVQTKRHDLFMAAFKQVSENIDDIYKDLTQVEGVPLGGTAYLSLEDPTEPYLHGIKYNAMPPAKRFRDMDQLSGGERTVAALALIFAIHKHRPTPFFVMDEIDAALDNVNVTRVAEYIRERAADGALQFVVISLKDNFYEKAHGLVGIYRDRREECSACVTLDLEALSVGAEEEEAM